MDFLGLFAIAGALFLIIAPFILGWLSYKRFGAPNGKVTTKSFLSSVLLATIIPLLVLIIFVVLLTHLDLGASFFLFLLFYFGYAFILTLAGAYPSFSWDVSKAPGNQINKRNQAIFAVLPLFLMAFIIFIILWQIGPGLHLYSSQSIVPKDWNKLQPLVPTVTYDGLGGNFTASFYNVAGTKVIITSITANETYSGTTCESILVGNRSEGAAIPVAAYAVVPGSVFKMDALQCGNKTRGDPYLMTLTINYNAVVSGVSTARTETGTIRGNAE
jgi:hypothetical protein